MAVKKPLKHVETIEMTRETVPMSDERITYAELMPSSTDSLDPDAEASFQDWAEALGESRSAYIIRAYRLPTDKDGRIQGNASSGQMISLGAWPLDSIKYDELIELLRNEYMLPGTSVMAVRLMVTQEGSRGVKKNQIVQIQRALRGAAHGTVPTKDSAAELMRAMQENNAVMMQQFQQMMRMSQPVAPAQPVDPMDSMVKMMGIFMPLVTALAGRPQPAGLGMGEMVDVILKLKDLSGGNDSGNDSDGADMIGMIKAIAPLAQPVLTTFAANAQAQAAHAVERANNPQRQLAPPVAPGQRREINPQPSVSISKPVNPVSASPQGMTYFEGNEVPMFMLQIRPQIQQLCDLAAQVPQPDPVEVAKMALDSIPEEHDDKLGDLLFNENFMKWLAMLDSRVNDHRQWFDTLHVTMKNAFADPDSPAE
jgi:hypothetical protein